MKRVFADTSFLVALLTAHDRHHAAAGALSRNANLYYVTSEYVLLESANFFRSPDLRGAWVDFVGALRENPRTQVVDSDPLWFRRGMWLFSHRLDKEWSLADCISFEIMSDLGITDALTADRHFTQAGFKALLV